MHPAVPGGCDVDIVAKLHQAPVTAVSFAIEQDTNGRLSRSIGGSGSEPPPGPPPYRIRAACGVVAGGQIAEGFFHVSFR